MSVPADNLLCEFARSQRRLRERVNAHYLSDDVHKLGTRTMRSLIDEIQHEQQQAS